MRSDRGRPLSSTNSFSWLRQDWRLGRGGDFSYAVSLEWGALTLWTRRLRTASAMLGSARTSCGACWVLCALVWIATEFLYAPPHHAGFDRFLRSSVPPRAIRPMAQVGKGIGSHMIFAKQLARRSPRRHALSGESSQAPQSGCDSFADVSHGRSAMHPSAAVRQWFVAARSSD
jgi:hypothetical protein